MSRDRTWDMRYGFARTEINLLSSSRSKTAPSSCEFFTEPETCRRFLAIDEPLIAICVAQMPNQPNHFVIYRHLSPPSGIFWR